MDNSTKNKNGWVKYNNLVSELLESVMNQMNDIQTKLNTLDTDIKLINKDFENVTNTVGELKGEVKSMSKEFIEIKTKVKNKWTPGQWVLLICALLGSATSILLSIF